RAGAGRRSAAADAWRRSRGCGRAPRGRHAGSRRSRRGRRGTTRAGASPRAPSSVRPDVVDLEVVELPRRAVAPEAAGIDVVDAGALEQRAQLRHVLLAQLLLDAVGAEPRELAAHVDARLVDRVAERIARVAADDEPP